jgi:hypothetical protein
MGVVAPATFQEQAVMLNVDTDCFTEHLPIQVPPVIKSEKFSVSREWRPFPKSPLKLGSKVKKHLQSLPLYLTSVCGSGGYDYLVCA